MDELFAPAVSRSGHATRARRAYASPQLLRFGDLASLTAGSLSTMMDDDKSMTLTSKAFGSDLNPYNAPWLP